MSATTKARVLAHSRTKGTARLLLAEMAEAADEEDIASLSVPTLREKANVYSIRRIQQILRRLENIGEIFTQSGGGRGHLSSYFICIGLTADSISDRLTHRFNFDQAQANTLAEKLALHPLTAKSITTKEDSPNLQTCQPSNILNPSNPAIPHAHSSLKTANNLSQPIAVLSQSTSTQIIQQREIKPRNGAKSIADPRTNHPAIALFREITGRYPNRQLYECIITALGAQPDPIKARTCYHAWLERGYNPNAATWATEWYTRDASSPIKPNPSSTVPRPLTHEGPLHNHDPDPSAIATFLDAP
jgi:hypothetical protein